MNPAEAHHHRARPIATALRLLLPLLVVGLLAAAFVAAVGGAAVWLLRTEDGSRWLLARVPGVKVEGLRGGLLQPHVEADRVVVTWGGGTSSVTITGFVGDGLRWQFQPRRGLWFGIDATRLVARDVIYDGGPPSGKPAAVPKSLRIPLRVASDDVQIETLKIHTLDAWHGVRGRAAVSDGDAYELWNTRFEWGRITVHGDARLGMSAPFDLKGRVQVTPADGRFDSTVQAGGTLDRMQLAATLRGTAAEGRTAPSADVQAEVLPFAPWPLGRLAAQTQALDLASLSDRLPQTRLSGRADVVTRAKDAPITAAIQLDNALPGRWNEGRLPLQRLVLDAGASAAQRDRVEFKDVDLLLGDGRQPAGRVRGKGLWNGAVVTAEGTLDGLRPQLLDSRAAAMLLSGPVSFSWTGAPSPAGGTTPPPPLALALRATLDGRMDAAPLPVQVVLDATAADDRVEIRDLRARSGGALAQLRANLRRGARGTLELATSGTLTDFDPLPWWPGETASPWRQGPHRLSGSWQADVRLPAQPQKMALLALLPSLSGSGTLRLSDSVLAGVPLAAELALGQAPSTEGTPGTLRGEVRLGSNVVTVDGRGDPLGPGTADRLQLELDAPALATLAPLLRLVPQAAAWAPKSGSAKASLSAQGRWPVLRTEGQAQLQQLETADVGLARASLRWALPLDREGRQPLELQADITGLRVGRQRADALQAELRGTLREHRIALAGALPLAPPALAEQLFGLQALQGTRAQLAAEGAWEPAAGGGGRWRGQVTRLAVGAWDGSALAGDTRASWVDARDISADLQFDAQGNLDRVQAPAGRMRLAETLSLRWDAIDVNLAGKSPNIDLKADVETFMLAPLLARMQPAFGWKGDLALGARVELKASERFDADIVFERRSGDLQVSDETGSQALGLTDFRIALAAHDGNWVFTQAFAGRTLGEMAGVLSVKTAPDRRWPAADAPIDGVVEARVANLGVWGAWVPPGWRLSGELRTSATLGGRWSAPEYTGRMRGTELGVRNLLQGVNVSQGEVDIALKGASAQIERFTLKGGDGTLQLSGGAQFGSKPTAQLRLQAERFRVLGRIDRMLVASGSADMALSAERVQLDGRVRIDEGLFDASRSDAPKLDDDVTVHRAGDPERPADAAAAQRPRRDVAVAVDVDLGDQLRLKGRGLDTALKGRLRITTPAGRMNVQGTVNTEGGTYAAYGQKLEIDRGIVAFSGAADNPRLDILALRQNIDNRVGVQITGNLLTPRVRLYSETDLSETDKLSWLVLGRASDGLGRNDTALLQRAAVALLAGEGEAPTDTFMRNIGLDELTLRQSDTDVRETVISLGKQLSRRWYLGYERGVNATTGTWQLIYRIAQRFTLRAQSGQENSLDIIWTWRLDQPAATGVRKSPPTPP